MYGMPLRIIQKKSEKMLASAPLPFSILHTSFSIIGLISTVSCFSHIISFPTMHALQRVHKSILASNGSFVYIILIYIYTSQAAIISATPACANVYWQWLQFSLYNIRIFGMRCYFVCRFPKKTKKLSSKTDFICIICVWVWVWPTVQLVYTYTYNMFSLAGIICANA